MAGVDPLALKGVLLEGHVTIERALSETPYFVAYRAVVRGLGEPVALKAFRVGPKADAARVTAFVDAIAACAGAIESLSARDPGAPSLVSYGMVTAGGNRVPYLATKWVEGQSLAAELDLRTAAVPLPEVAVWLRDVSGVLDAAHALGVVHGDLSPATLLLEKADKAPPRLRVADVGVSALLETFGADLTGAPRYEPKNAPPEQLDPLTPERSPRADVHALALTLLEAMLPRLKRKTGPLAQRKKRSLEAGDRPTPKKLGLSVSPAFAEAIERAIAARPEDRFASIPEMLDAFRRAEPSFATRSMGPIAAAKREPPRTGSAAAPKPSAPSADPVRVGGANGPPPALRIGGASDPPPPLRAPRGPGLAGPLVPPAPKAPSLADALVAEATAVDLLPEGAVDAPATEPPPVAVAPAEVTAVDRLAPPSADAPASRPVVAEQAPLADATRMAIPVDARFAAAAVAMADAKAAGPAPVVAPVEGGAGEAPGAPFDASRTMPLTDAPAAGPPAPPEASRAAAPMGAEPSAPFDASRTAPLGDPAVAAARALAVGPAAEPAPAPFVHEAAGAALLPTAPLLPNAPGPAPWGGASASGPSAPAPVAESARFVPTSPQGAVAASFAGGGSGVPLVGGAASHGIDAVPVRPAADPRAAAFARRASQGSLTDDDPPMPPLESSRPLVIGAAAFALVLVLVIVGFVVGGRKTTPVAEPASPTSAATISSASASAAPPALPPATAPSAIASAPPAPPSASTAAAAAFDATKAQAALEAVPGTQSECRKLNGPRGKWKATVTFEPTGKVSEVELDKPFNRTPAGKCVQNHLKTAEVPEFPAPAQKVTTLVTIAVAGK